MQLDMTKGKPLPVILQFTIPLVIGNIFQQLYNMADTIIVGRYVGAGALAAVGSTGTIMFLATGFAQGITAGFSILTAQRYGAGDKKGVKRSVANGIILAMIAAAILTLVCVSIMNPLLHLMNTPSDIFQDAYTYIMGISIGLTANIFYNLFSAYLRAVGNSQVPLFFLIFSACLNVGLDLLFIIRGGMGVAGAAWATNLSQAISAVLCAGYIWVKVPSLKPEREHWKIHGSDTRNQLAAGIPMAFQFAITASGTMIMQSAINLFGEAPESRDPGHDRHGTDDGDLRRTELRMRGCKADQGRGKGSASCGVCVFRHSSITHVCAAQTMSRTFLYRGRGYFSDDAVGRDLLLYDCDVFPAALHDLYFPQYHAGLRIWLPADDGRCIGTHRETDRLHGGDEAFELSARLFRRSGGMDRSGGIYGCLVSLCDKKDRERA